MVTKETIDVTEKLQVVSLLSKTDYHYITANSLWAKTGPVMVRVYKQSLREAVNDAIDGGYFVFVDVFEDFMNWYCAQKPRFMRDKET